MSSAKKDQPIGKRLMKLRKDKKLTLKHLANETGLNPRFISKVEKAEVMPAGFGNLAVVESPRSGLEPSASGGKKARR